MKKQQILLVGMPRSGTSWLAKIFDSHPDTAYFHEPDSSIKLNFLDLVEERELTNTELDRISRTINSFWANQEERVIGSLPTFRKNYFSGAQYTIYRASNIISKYSARAIGSQILPPIRPIGDANTLVWKSIESLGRVAQIKQALKERIKIVQIVRHPGGQIYSTLTGESKNKFGGYSAAEDFELLRRILNTSTAAQLGVDPDDLTAMSPVQRLAMKWAVYNDHAISSRACDVTVNYDALCESPLAVVEAVFAKIGLDVTDEVRQFLFRSTGENQSRYYSVYKNPKASSEKWRSQMALADQQEIAELLKNSHAYRMFS